MGISLALTVALILVAWAGAAAGLQVVLGTVIPYLAGLTFLGGLIWRVVRWARAPVPFRIPTTCGQQKSLPWIRYAAVDNPATTLGVVARVALEVLLFRSLLRNSRFEFREGPKLVYFWEKWLWVAGLAFHWSLFVILTRHLRFFTQPVPAFVGWLEGADGFFQVWLSALYLTDVVVLVAVTYLFLRRVLIPQVRYVSLPADYFPLFLIMGIAGSGVLMRYFFRVDVTAVKELALGLVTFHPVLPPGLSALFYVHLFLVSVLLVYFPFSKLVHMAGIFLSPTRNLANTNRERRHINPWNYPVKVHTYEEYEEEFRKHMIAAGIPVERTGGPAAAATSVERAGASAQAGIPVEKEGQ